MLAFSSAFGEVSANAANQGTIALWVAAGGAALSIAGLAIVCIGLVIRPSRAAEKGRLYVPVHHRTSYTRPDRRRGRRPSAHGQSPITAEQPVVAG